MILALAFEAAPWWWWLAAILAAPYVMYVTTLGRKR